MTVHCPWTLDALVAAYERHQRRTRGSHPMTVRTYTYYVRLFLRAVLDEDRIDVRRLRPSDAIEFLSATTSIYRTHTVKLIATSLRSFFAFLRFEGVGHPGLQTAVPTVAGWRFATLPRSLSDEQHRRLLASLDGSTPRRRRDRAILLCLSGLGLRAREVADLRLDDLDWRAGVVRVRTRKTGRGAVLPLPSDAGRAIAAYLRDGRPASKERHVFLLHRGRVGAPIVGRVVTGAVIDALEDAGIDDAPSRGAHLLRHTFATRLVRRGASLKEIADVLGHRSLDTTTIYAKVDLPSLSEVALPWPQVSP